VHEGAYTVHKLPKLGSVPKGPHLHYTLGKVFIYTTHQLYWDIALPYTHLQVNNGPIQWVCDGGALTCLAAACPVKAKSPGKDPRATGGLFRARGGEGL
jgi:hypothetical protein